MRLSPAFLLAAMLMIPIAANAHHSLNATYVLDQHQLLRGTVKQFLFRNPHSFILLDAPDQNGQMQEWEIEWSGGGALWMQGIRKDTLQAGDELEITLAPAKDPLRRRGLLRILRRTSDGFEWGRKPGEVVPEWIGVAKR